MTIKEQQIGIISEYLPKCVSDSTDCFVYGSIPRNRFDGARKSYASNVVYDDVLGLVDTTIFGGGERGMVLTTTGIYIKEVLSSPTYYSYENYSKMPLPSEVFFIQGNLSVMFKKLAELANKAVKQNNAKGFWGSLLEFAGETIVSAIEESAETYKNELIAQQEKENEEALESICNIRDTIKDLREVFSEMIIDYDDLETYDEVYNKIVGTYVLSCACTNDLSTCNKLITVPADEDNHMETFATEICNLEETLDELLKDSEKDDVEPLSRTFKRFRSKMDSIFDMIQEDTENLDTDEWEELYDRSQKAVKTVNQKLMAIVRMLNEAIEEEYDD